MPAKKRKPTEAEIDRMRRLGTILRNSGAELEQARAESLDTLDARLREYGIDPERYDAWDRLEIASGILDTEPGPLTLREILNRLEGRAAAGESQAAPAVQQDKTLTALQQEVYEYIRDHQPVMGTEICNHTGCLQSSLTRHIIPVLTEKRGVRNQRGAGYYIE